MLSPEEFREEYDDEELAAELPDSPISSLRSIQYLYGKLYTLGTLGGGQYAPYLTPDAAGDLTDTDDSLIVVRMDASSDEPSLADDDQGPVWVTRYSEDLVQNVAHCKYPAARGIDHSITHQAGQNSDPEKLARYSKERLTKWAVDDEVQDVADEHDDGWIIDALAALGDDEDILESIDSGVTDALGGESTTALLTVQVKTEPDGDFRWPGEIDGFMEAMRRRKLSKLVTKNKADDSSGEATDLVTGDGTRTVGTAEDPQNYFLGKQLEKFPGLDIEEAWRSHPISEDAAITVMNAETFVDECSYRTFGAKVYYLPYFQGVPTPDGARELYGLLYHATNDDDMTPVERAYQEFQNRDIDYELRFYVSAVMPHQMSRYDVYGETMNGRLLYPKTLAVEHNNVVGKATAFNSKTDRTAPIPTHGNWALLTGDDRRLHAVSTGWYFGETFAERDDDEAAADDPRIDALIAVLSGDSIAVETVLEEYVDRIDTDENDENVESFPSFRVASQFAQLCALATDELDLLSTDDPGREPITKEPNYEEYSMETAAQILATDGGNPAAEKLETFIEDTPALAHDPEAPLNDQRRGAFLLGVLIGEVGGYQNYSEERSTTLIDQYPVKSITRTRIKKVTQEAIGKTITYTRNEDRTITLFEHVVERLRETILRPDPDEWEIETDDLRFYYALGVTYGMNDHPDWDQTETDTEEEH
ncbi:CRISPR-associated protein Csh1 family protein [Halorhabdus tiamatea SARL4B]|uniref:CRISPR-associated protein Csh1 family protein n=1 Tax=Halorhabdus tiamatea SARL4B TaxID=1033806 RepID=F7PNQ1_9EURY|nr:type I-B CRISPR-associated protein Cas8b/Csh1 [Halorhabdus tiamatea]ERJ06790.1 CRISPR-associated protein Csh1 family protein [Halorhabdus tiamatea SARL4B]CCQ33713.1 CRISPR-associated protein, Csh1 [Halorhabdus tiamatea SARL4B]